MSIKKNVINGFLVSPGIHTLEGATPMEGAINFTIISTKATSCELLLFHREGKKPYAVLPFPDQYRIGHVFSMLVYDLNIEEFEYAYRLDGPYDPHKGLLFDKHKYILDPYAKAIVGQSKWGTKQEQNSFYKARVVHHAYDWGSGPQPDLPMEDLVIYELHVRGFTQDDSSKVTAPGTFAGLQEKIPYLKDLGINAVELMPIFEFDECKGHRRPDGQELLDYWGYNTIGFFAPNTSYSHSVEYNREGRELLETIHALHDHNIEVILDVVFNHTAEGNEYGPCFSFKGLDNHVYYMLTPDGYYYNFSGCGNTLNCNHPIVQQMILSCLRYWTVHYHIDGFRFDLASILGRNEDGSPMSQPPLLKNLAFDPILANTKLIAEAWDAGGMYQVGNFPSWNRWAEWNGKYRDDLRSFLKGDEGRTGTAALRIIGSPDLYDPEHRGHNASVNFINCHDGFTLYDLYSYNQKHNDDNGWGNTDGDNNNLSWNCGCEGETSDPQILALRKKMIKNACATLMLSRGTPMFFSGDEFGNTQFGNNNGYCQDNPISWLDWNRAASNQDLLEFFKFFIHFRLQHGCIRKDLQPSMLGFPSVSIHGCQPWQQEFTSEERGLGILYAGQTHQGTEDAVFLFVNAFWESMHMVLPQLSSGSWKLIADTGQKDSLLENQNILLTNGDYLLSPRSLIVCEYLPTSALYPTSE